MRRAAQAEIPSVFFLAAQSANSVVSACSAELTAKEPAKTPCTRRCAGLLNDGLASDRRAFAAGVQPLAAGCASGGR